MPTEQQPQPKPRRFVYDGREFPDPDPALSIDEVRQQLAEFFSELVNADQRRETKDGSEVITFSRRIGTKGREALIAALVQVPEARLRLLELADACLDGEGRLVRLPEAGEFTLACLQAKGYAEQTRRIREALRGLPAR